MRDLTDLEGAALGRVWAKGGATAYAVRCEFRDSVSAHFSDSAGSVYPMFRRLVARGLLRGRDAARGDRDGTTYTCTSAGLAALRAWLAVPEESAELVTHDPLRTRILFLGLLTAAQRRSWFDRAERGLRAHLATLEGRADEPEAQADRWLALAHRSAILQAHARLEWIREARSV